MVSQRSDHPVGKHRIYSREGDTHLVVTAASGREAIARAGEMFPAFMVGPRPWRARPFRKREAQIEHLCRSGLATSCTSGGALVNQP